MNTVSLSSLRPGTDCRLQELLVYGAMRRRLRDLGFLEGARLHCAYIAPSGTPMAVYCKGTLIALRREDCRRIQVQICA